MQMFLKTLQHTGNIIRFYYQVDRLLSKKLNNTIDPFRRINIEITMKKVLRNLSFVVDGSILTTYWIDGIVEVMIEDCVEPVVDEDKID